MDYSLLKGLEVFFPIFNNGCVNISFLSTFYIKNYITALVEALKPAIWCSKFCIVEVFGKLECFFSQHGTCDGEFSSTHIFEPFPDQFFKFSITCFTSTSLFWQRFIGSNWCKNLSRFFKILSTWVFQTKNFSASTPWFIFIFLF